MKGGRAGTQPARAFQPVSTGRHHRTERNPLLDKHIGVKADRAQCMQRLVDVGELGLRQQQRSAVREQVGSRRAQRVEHQPAITSGVDRQFRYVRGK